MTTKIDCQLPDCEYVAEHASEAVAIAMLTSHNMTHLPSSSGSSSSRAPKIDRPVLKQDITDEEWTMFKREWERFKKCFSFTDNLNDQLFQCCVDKLRDLLLRMDPNICDGTEASMLTSMEKMAVLHQAATVRRTRLFELKQAHGQPVREFFAMVRSAASSCKFEVKCRHPCCAVKTAIDYSPCMVKDIFICGLDDADIKKDILSLSDLDSKTDSEILAVAEEKEIARNAVDGAGAAALSSYNRNRRNPAHPGGAASAGTPAKEQQHPEQKSEKG